VNLLRQFKLPIKLPDSCDFTPQQIIECMYLDKKTVGGELRFILPTKIGHVETVAGVSIDLVREVLVDGF